MAKYLNQKPVLVAVDCIIFGFDEAKLKVLLIRSDLKKFAGKWSLLGDLVFPKEDLDAAAYRIACSDHTDPHDQNRMGHQGPPLPRALSVPTDGPERRFPDWRRL